MIQVNGKEVDLGKALPLTIGDFKAMKKAGLDLAQMKGREADLDADQVFVLIEYLIHKADPSIEQSDIDHSPMSALKDWSEELNRLMPQQEEPSPSS